MRMEFEKAEIDNAYFKIRRLSANRLANSIHIENQKHKDEIDISIALSNLLQLPTNEFNRNLYQNLDGISLNKMAKVSKLHIHTAQSQLDLYKLLTKYALPYFASDTPEKREEVLTILSPFASTLKKLQGNRNHAFRYLALTSPQASLNINHGKLKISQILMAAWQGLNVDHPYPLQKLPAKTLKIKDLNLKQRGYLSDLEKLATTADYDPSMVGIDYISANIRPFSLAFNYLQNRLNLNQAQDQLDLATAKGDYRSALVIYESLKQIHLIRQNLINIEKIIQSNICNSSYNQVNLVQLVRQAAAINTTYLRQIPKKIATFLASSIRL